MTILLIRPPAPQFYNTVGPDLGYGYLSAALQRAGLRVVIVDLMRQHMSDLRRVVRREEISQIGFKLYSKDIPPFRKIMDVLREEYRDRKMPPILAGGPLPTGLREEFLQLFPEVSHAFVGEAEEGYPLFAARLESGESANYEAVPGLMYRDGDTVRVNQQHFPADLDALGFPDFSQMPPASYVLDYTGYVFVTLMTTRGCPYQCNYCAGPLANGRKVRRRSAEHVLAEMRQLKEQYGVAMISIVDDNFTFNADHARAILEGMIEQNLGLKWRTPNGIRLDTLDADLVDLFDRSGCEELYLGIESGSPQVLKDMNRQVTVETYREKVGLLAKHTKARLMGFFILGYPTEREQDVRQSVDLALSLPVHRAAFFFFTPHPGTPIFAEMKQRGELPDDLWDSFFYEKPSLGSRHVPLSKLQRHQRMAYFRFYLRPRILWGLLASIRGPRQFLRLVQRVVGVVLGA